MRDAGGDHTATASVTETIDAASRFVLVACDKLTSAIDELTLLLRHPGGEAAADALARYTAARAVLLPHLDTMDRARDVLGG
jgi:hypothetical protein